MIGCLRTRVRKQPSIALYFESETVLKVYNLEALVVLLCYAQINQLSSLDTLIMYVFVIKVLSEINAESNSAKRTGNRTIVLQGQL